MHLPPHLSHLDTSSATGMGRMFRGCAYMGEATATFEIVEAPSFTDSTAHSGDIAWLASTGISKGWDVAGGKEFRPNANVARADMAAFLYRLDPLPVE